MRPGRPFHDDVTAVELHSGRLVSGTACPRNAACPAGTPSASFRSRASVAQPWLGGAVIASEAARDRLAAQPGPGLSGCGTRDRARWFTWATRLTCR
jgi:hypothetical protein